MIKSGGGKAIWGTQTSQLQMAVGVLGGFSGGELKSSRSLNSKMGPAMVEDLVEGFSRQRNSKCKSSECSSQCCAVVFHTLLAGRGEPELKCFQGQRSPQPER